MKQAQEEIDKAIDDYCASKICPYRWTEGQPGECLGRDCMKFSTKVDIGELSVGYGDILCEGIPVNHMRIICNPSF